MSLSTTSGVQENPLTHAPPPSSAPEMNTIIQNVQLAKEDENKLVGLDSLFQQDDDSDSEEEVVDDNNTKKEEEEKFCPIEMKQYELDIGTDISLRLVQAPAAFGGSGEDDTGLVLWGASVVLARFLVSGDGEADNIVRGLRGKKVMELGCGGAVPSLVANRLGAAHVFATDFRQRTLDHVRYHIEQNDDDDDSSGGSGNMIHALHLDWENHDPANDSLEVDVIMAADVIYGVSKVPALVSTIDKYLVAAAEEEEEDHNNGGGIVVIAARDGRRGIEEFRFLMNEANFEEIYVETIPHENDDDLSCFRDEISLSRWKSNHTIYVFRRRKRRQRTSSS